jgi:glycyl-tRNA synthetase beta chain
MKKHDALIEIFTEELPPKALWRLANAFSTSVEASLKEAGLQCLAVKPLAAPRRLALIISELDEAQATQAVERRGPAIAAAFDKEGKPTKAAEGFAKSCGTSVEKLERMKTDKGEWLCYCATEEGKTTESLLPNMVNKALSQLPIPKLMRWGSGETRFVRPVHNVLMLFGRRVVEAEVLGLQTTHFTFGHRFHHPKKIVIRKPADYQRKLEKAKVVVDFEKRREMILSQINQLAQEKQAKVVMPAGLLDEVTSLVEWPHALLGEFDDRFLALPREVLISVMQQHQKCFAIENQQQKLLANFITVSNIESKSPEQVVVGNRRVMRARLSDAEFFYRQDKLMPLSERVDDLKHILFQKSLGTLFDKTQRVVKLVELLAPQLNADEGLAKQAALLAKTDLMTDMVGEFPELQGIMGRYYAEHDGEPGAVAVALDEQYMPRFSGDELPRTVVGQALALADRIDSIVGIFGIGKGPTGEKDPFALRRATLGVLRLIIEKRLNVDVRALIESACQVYGGALPNKNVMDDVLSFVRERHRYLSMREGFSAEIFAAVSSCEPKSFVDFYQRMDAVKAFKAMPEAESLAAANKRVKNILQKQTKALADKKVNQMLLQEPAEKALYAAVDQRQASTRLLLEKGDYKAVLAELAGLRSVVDQFFDGVMVMCDDEKLRDNRLALLMSLRGLFLQVADVSVL